MARESQAADFIMPKKSPPTAKKGPEKVIYLGPTIVDGAFLLKSNTIYSNGLPPDVAERVKVDPELAKFIVPIGKKVVSTMNKLTNADSDLALLNAHVRNKYLNMRKKAR
jgi:hypothetical protein